MIVGVDPASARLAVAAQSKIGWNMATYKLGSPFEPQNCRTAAEGINDFLRCHVHAIGTPRIAVIEAPVIAGARNIQSTLKQAMVIGGIMSAFGEWEFDVRTVAVSSWKKVVVGHGGATKETVASYLRQRWPEAAALCGTSQDLIDATCIALYGERLVKEGSL